MDVPKVDEASGAYKNSEECSTSGRENQTPFERISQALKFATTRIEPGDPVPEVPAELKEWAENTAMGSLAGMLYCGGRQFAQNRKEGLYRPPQGGLSPAQVARLIAEENTRRLIRLGNETLKGGLRFGALTGLFFGVQLLSSIARDRRDMQDTVNAALVTGGLFGALLPGTPAFRLRSAILGAALGGVVAVPASSLQEQVEKLAPEGMRGTGFCPNGTKGTLRVAGQGIKETKSDQAKVSMTVEVTSASAIAARDKASTLASSILGNLSAINGIGSDNAQTSSVSVNPKYGSGDSSNTIVGYTYSNQINVNVKNLTSDLLSEVLDTAVASGGNQLQIQRVSFSLSDATTAEVMVAARKLSVASAKAAAEIYASELGVTVGGISSVVSSSASMAPQSSNNDNSLRTLAYSSASSDSLSSSTPISIGQQTVTDSIVVEYFICTPSS
ncbi:hypothetical protein WJX75_004165 [Coccomyxa subellipsoidea]|uniref:DUF541-domain-containing protein n=1 Tax=Coccomyxa subellipsoidea TaxID=248742 RepID=A0ABR2YJ95_9CHLO